MKKHDPADLFLHFANLEVSMIIQKRPLNAEFANRQKRKYYRLSKIGH
ncbi:hypothetical protein [Sporolactobacillus terrae]|nr:hypothetical protein [Sporolactobacillus terrae]